MRNQRIAALEAELAAERARVAELEAAASGLLKRTRIMIREWEEVFGTEDENRTPGDVLERTKEVANSVEKVLGKAAKG